mgnify:CR=1
LAHTANDSILFCLIKKIHVIKRCSHFEAVQFLVFVIRVESRNAILYMAYTGQFVKIGAFQIIVFFLIKQRQNV